jgi:hypothetical protein
VEEVRYPDYVRNPSNTRTQQELPAPGALGSTEAAHHIDATRDLTPEVRPVETEVVEDVYDE